MLFITSDQMLIMATQVKDSHKVTFEELQLLVKTIKKNIEGTKIRVMIPAYPTLSNGNRGWQQHFYVQDGKYHQFNTGEETEKYNKENIEKFRIDLINSGLTEQEADSIIFSSLAEFKMLVNPEKQLKKVKK